MTSVSAVPSSQLRVRVAPPGDGTDVHCSSRSNNASRAATRDVLTSFCSAALGSPDGLLVSLFMRTDSLGGAERPDGRRMVAGPVRVGAARARSSCVPPARGSSRHERPGAKANRVRWEPGPNHRKLLVLHRGLAGRRVVVGAGGLVSGAVGGHEPLVGASVVPVVPAVLPRVSPHPEGGNTNQIGAPHD